MTTVRGCVKLPYMNYEEQVREITRERNAAIVAMRMEGLTFQQIGEAMGLTRQRIQQIVAEITENEGKGSK